ncbi:NRDE family protein [Balneolaceae bacterium YR4-1]|uniref:NRDE family protein n=1 Tax=Halalkalibaculum roseum TaxID=2709311 RepID=A0A6M1STM7_9BACT|nr:NRDE family protein [Halalkalibaculum roseum]NGP75496.1 NRDE family protein [Halalkalibaculum roseum]
MCLLVFSYKQHPIYDFVFATNRDEFYDRPTRPAKFWSDHPNILAGKDLQAGGTWLGITKNGKFSALTNYRDPSIQKEDPPSRGHLVLDYLKEGKTIDQYLKDVDKKANQYNGFNLLSGNLSDGETGLMYYSNQQNEIRRLEAGLYGLSNKLLDTPWPKVTRAKKALDTLIRSGEVSEEKLFDLLQDDTQASEEELPDTGIPHELEKAVSPIFIKTDRYGTRNSTVILVEKSGKVIFEERRYQNGSMEVENTNRYEFFIEHG